MYPGELPWIGQWAMIEYAKDFTAKSPVPPALLLHVPAQTGTGKQVPPLFELDCGSYSSYSSSPTSIT